MQHKLCVSLTKKKKKQKHSGAQILVFILKMQMSSVTLGGLEKKVRKAQITKTTQN